MQLHLHYWISGRQSCTASHLPGRQAQAGNGPARGPHHRYLYWRKRASALPR